jgi:hypothetical protein
MNAILCEGSICPTILSWFKIIKADQEELSNINRALVERNRLSQEGNTTKFHDRS